MFFEWLSLVGLLVVVPLAVLYVVGRFARWQFLRTQRPEPKTECCERQQFAHTFTSGCCAACHGGW